MAENFFLKYQNRAERAETNKKPAPKFIVWSVIIIVILSIANLFYSISGSIYMYSKYKFSKTESEEGLAYFQASHAIQKCDVSRLELVLEKFPKFLNKRCPEGDTLLFKAAGEVNGLRSAALLLSRGADPTLACENGCLAIHAYPGNRETIKLLQIYGLRLDIFAAAGHGFLEEIENLAKSDPECVNRRGPAGLTALEHAAWTNNRKAAAALIEHGAKVDIISAARMGYADKAEELLSSNPELANFLSLSNPYRTPLKAAVISGNSQIVKLLLENGAEVKFQTRHTDHLQLAAKYDRVEISKMLLKALADENDISGRIIDSDGNPIASAEIDAWTWYKGCETSSNRLGFFILKNIPSDGDTAQIRITATGYCPELITYQPMGVSDLGITLTNDTYFSGRAYDRDGTPASGAVIRAKQGPMRAEGVMISSIWTETKTDPNGYYKLYVDDDDYTLFAQSGSSFQSSAGRHKIQKRQNVNVDFHFTQSCGFRAYMIDGQSNKPVVDAAIADWHNPYKQAFSDYRGYLEIEGLRPGKHFFIVQSNGYGRWRSEQSVITADAQNNDNGFERNFDLLCFNIEPNSPDIAEIYLERAAAVSGKVTDPHGRAVEKVTVTAALTGTGNSLSGDSRFKTTTEKNGNYKLFLPASKQSRYNLVAHVGNMHQWKDWANGVSQPFSTRPGQEISNIDITLNHPCRIKGRVVTLAGKGSPGVKVRATAADFRGNRYFNPSAVTDENGRFVLEYLRPGKHYIQTEPFWLDPKQAPARSRELVEVLPDSRLSDILLVSMKNNGKLSLK